MLTSSLAVNFLRLPWTEYRWENFDAPWRLACAGTLFVVIVALLGLLGFNGEPGDVYYEMAAIAIPLLHTGVASLIARHYVHDEDGTQAQL